VNEVLYHYTNPTAFLGIIQGQSIWASNLNYLNDEQEFIYLVGLLLPRLRDISHDTQQKELIKTLVRLIEKNNGGPTYVVSFSEVPDSLSQWRAYCTDGGFSIGFHHQKLVDIAGKDGGYFVQCVYDLESQTSLIDSFLSTVKVELEKLDKPISDRKEILEFYSSHIYGHLILLANKIKHPAFEAEREWRMVKPFIYANHPRKKYRAGNGMLVSYLEIDLVNTDDKYELFLPIHDIYLCPHKNAELSEESARTFIISEQAKYQNSDFVKIIRSSAPYRAL
jgi:hypothetical protein